MRQHSMDDDFEALHRLLSASFAYMEGQIDPPSSMTRLSIEGLWVMATNREIRDLPTLHLRPG